MPRATPWLLEGDFTRSLPFGDATYDLLLCTGCDKVFEGQQCGASDRAAQWATLAGESLRVLRPGGSSVVQGKLRFGNYELRPEAHWPGAAPGLAPFVLRLDDRERLAPSALFDGSGGEWAGSHARNLTEQQVGWLVAALRTSAAGCVQK